MDCCSRFPLVCVAAAVVVAGSLGFAQATKDGTKTGTKATTPPAAAKDHQLPPGMTEADMQACIEAGTPGEQHEWLAKAVGTWTGKCTMWMAPDTEPTTGDCTSTISTMMDGRFTKCEMTGESPMGPYQGFGLYGYDNTSEKFQSTWIGNCGTAMMTGTGNLSSDKKTLTWTYSHSCPITKKPTTFREVETITGDNTRKFEMYMTDPKSGKEFKSMELVLTRKPGSGAAAAAGTR